MSYASTIKSVWLKLSGFDVDAKRAPLPPVEKHLRRLQEWSNRRPGKNLGDACSPESTSRVDEILAEIDQAHADGRVWDAETHDWRPPKASTRKPRTTMKSNGPVFGVDAVLKIFPGARVVGPEPTPEDWAAIEEEAARWSRDAEGVWHKRDSNLGGCRHCSGKDVPEWRRGGKLVEVRYPDGTQAFSCHFCGRRIK